MDTETAKSGFTRSIVMKAGLTPKDVRAGAAGSATASAVSSLPGADLGPSLAGTGIKLGIAGVRGAAVGGLDDHARHPVHDQGPQES